MKHSPLFGLAIGLWSVSLVGGETAKIEPVVEIYVDSLAEGSGLGTIERPFISLEEARDHLRGIAEDSELKTGARVINLREGSYSRLASFQLAEQDGGTADSPVIYQAFENETVWLSGGVTLGADQLEVVTDAHIIERLQPDVRSQVRKLDLNKLGVTLAELGEIQYWQKGGLTYPAEQGAVWIDGKKLEPARFPKRGGGPEGDGFVKTGEVIHTGSIPRTGEVKEPEGGVFKFTDSQVANWKSHEDVWLFGYMKETYADGTLRIAAVDRDTGTISVQQPSWYGIGEGGRYFYLNVLEELSLPGEMFTDRENEVIYLIPPADANDESTVELSISSAPLIEMDGADHVTISGLNMELTRTDAIKIKNSSYVTVTDLSIRRIEGSGVIMPTEGVYQNTISRVVGSDLGGFGFSIGGGDRMTQQFGGSVVSDSRFSNFGLNRSGKSLLRGVGNTVEHCEFSECKEGALSISGNENIVEYCSFKFLNKEGSDAGAVYMGRNPSETGLKIRHNYFQDIGNEIEDHTGIQGVYVDDRSGFVEVSGNIFNRVGSGQHAAAFKANGGKYNDFSNNIVIDGRAAYIQVHSTTQAEWTGWFRGNLIAGRMEEVDASNPDSPWSRRYPIAYEAARTTIIPSTRTNLLKDNIVINGELVKGIIGGRYGDPLATEVSNRVIDHDPGFEDIEANDFRILERVMKLEFPDLDWIDFSAIGVREQ